jgi:hypothetical protein
MTMPRFTRHPWTPAQEQLLRRMYPDTPTAEIARRIGVSVRSVYSKAHALGLRKTPEFFASAESGRMQPGSRLGEKTRFRKGGLSWNKGLKGWCVGGRSVETRFKPGNRPHTWQPIGTERITKDGYRQRKMTETGYPPRDWVMVHRIVWEAHHGPIPKGRVVVFHNGDRQDCRIENLELISRKELAQRNSIHRFPPALREVIHIKKGLTRRIRNAERRADEKQD